MAHGTNLADLRCARRDCRSEGEERRRDEAVNVARNLVAARISLARAARAGAPPQVLAERSLRIGYYEDWIRYVLRVERRGRGRP